MEVKALYGTAEHQIDVTSVFLKTFVKEHIAYISLNSNLNRLFSDPAPGKVKTLFIFYQDVLVKSILENSTKTKYYRFSLKDGQQPKWNSNGILAVINFYDYDISWTRELKIPYIIMYKEAPDEQPYSALNKAKSETNILKFIIEFYDNLPEYVVFVHQYNKKFYLKESVVKRLNDRKLLEKLNNSPTNGFYNINDVKMKSIKPQLDIIKKSEWWKNTMLPYFGPMENYGDFTKDRKAAAQFIAKRDNIKSLPRKFYKNMYKWLCYHSLGDTVADINPATKMRRATKLDSHPLSHYHTSRYMEWSWELILTRKHIPVQLNLDNYLVKGNPEIRVLYGNNRNRVDVSEKFTTNFITRQMIVIPQKIKLNQMFFNHFLKPEELKDLVVITPKERILIATSDNEFNDLILDI